jgi:hypothetical protein
MRARNPFIVIFAALSMGYAGYPYLTLYQLREAVVEGNSARLSKLIDWPAVREGIKEDICDQVLDDPGQPVMKNQLPAFGASFVRGMAGNAVDRAFTAETLVAATRRGPDTLQSASSPEDGMHVTWAFFSSPANFRIDIATSGETTPIRVDMELHALTWQVKRVSFPPGLLERNPLHT